MANATKYVDNVNGNNGNTGNSEAQAYADIATALGAISGGGNTVYVQAGSNYVLTTALVISFSGDTTDGRNVIEGYTTTPGARDGRPTVTCATNGVGLFAPNTAASYWTFRHMNWTHTAATRGRGYDGSVYIGSFFVFEDLVIDGCSVGIYDGFGLPDVLVKGCWIKNCTSHGYQCGNGAKQTWIANRFDSNGGSGIQCDFCASTDVQVIVGNRFYNNAARGYLLTYQVGPAFVVRANQFRANGSDGFACTHASGVPKTLVHENNYYHRNGGYGVSFACGAVPLAAVVLSNDSNYYGTGGEGNTSGARNVLAAGTRDGTFSGDPNTAAGNVALNGTASAGAALRGAAYPPTFPGGEASYADVGPVQHQDAGGAPNTAAVFLWSG